MNTDRAYILGLVIGGGEFGANRNSFYIKLPFKQWGDIEKNPKRASEIGKDIMKVVGPIMRAEYGLSVSYEIGKREWKIICDGNLSELKKDLDKYGLSTVSEVKKNADISKVIADLVDDNMKKRFIAGIADTIGSMNPSHRRFSDKVQIISFEVPGFAFNFICQLCNLLYSVGCLPDQVEWQHPNFQSGTDAYYKDWKKGNKIRITLDAFAEFGAMAFKSKKIASEENRKKQDKKNLAAKCEEKTLSASGITTKHIDENCPALPDNVRGGHYLHHKHICAVLNCPHAPYNEVKRIMRDAETHICPFTVLHKDSLWNIKKIINNDPLMKKRTYREINISIGSIYNAQQDKKTRLLFNGPYYYYSSETEAGYPLNTVLDAVAFIIASKLGKLNGKRVQGSRNETIQQAYDTDPDMTIKFLVPDLLTPIVITDDNMAAMVGPMNPKVYKKLISIDSENPYKMIIRDITEADLR